jgi:hypothetical protein
MLISTTFLLSKEPCLESSLLESSESLEEVSESLSESLLELLSRLRLVSKPITKLALEILLGYKRDFCNTVKEPNRKA